MTTPNIEELRLLAQTLEFSDAVRCSIQRAADLLQSQAERIKELELLVKVKNKPICDYQELIAERDTLRAEIAAIAAAEPVAKLKPCKEGWFIDLDNPPPLTGETIELFTHPMPAQDVNAELVEALEMIVSTHQGHCEHHVGVSKHSYNLADIAEEALSKYKGAK